MVKVGNVQSNKHEKKGSGTMNRARHEEGTESWKRSGGECS